MTQEQSQLPEEIRERLAETMYEAYYADYEQVTEFRRCTTIAREPFYRGAQAVYHAIKEIENDA